jgi:hypothetical protein
VGTIRGLIPPKEEHMPTKEYEELKALIGQQGQKHNRNRSFRRRGMRLVSKAADVLYQTSPSTAKAHLNSVIAYAVDLKKMIDSGKTRP